MSDNYFRWSESIFKSKSMDTLLIKIDDLYEAKRLPRDISRAFLALLEALWYEYDGLKYDYKENNHSSLSLLAWRARNLLELNVWSKFCCLAPENSQFFFEEGTKDALNLADSLRLWGENTGQTDEWFKGIDASRDRVVQDAARHGHSVTSSKYMPLRKAAEACGMLDAYKLHNKHLSKFAHPTAFRLFLKRDKELIAKQGHYFLNQGALFFHDAFCKLEKNVADFEIKKNKNDEI